MVKKETKVKKSSLRRSGNRRKKKEGSVLSEGKEITSIWSLIEIWKVGRDDQKGDGPVGREKRTEARRFGAPAAWSSFEPWQEKENGRKSLPSG